MTKTIEIKNIEHAVFRGTDELKQLIENKLHRDRDSYKYDAKYYDFDVYKLERLIELNNECKNNELDLLIKEMKENYFRTLIIA